MNFDRNIRTKKSFIFRSSKVNVYFCPIELIIQMNSKRYLLSIVFCFCCHYIFSQTDVRPIIEKGNAFYNKNDFKNAAVQYKHACQLDSLSFDAWYNFGNALFQMKKYILSTEAYDKALKLTSDKTLKANILHNVGNIACEQGQYEKAVNFYKQSLLLNPKDDDTRYNLAFAQKQLEIQKKLDDLENQKKKEPEKQKPSQFAEECLKKAQELVQQYKFSDALQVMKDGEAKDKTVALFNEFTQKLENIVNIINNNQE